MAKTALFDTFRKAYNNFDSRPLQGDDLGRFFVGDFVAELTENVKTTIQISDRYRKMLFIGHRGCGKSTILNKVAEDLKTEFQVININAEMVLNINDIQTVDILLVTYMQVLETMEALGIKSSINRFEKLMEFVKDRLHIKEVGFNFLRTISFKLQVESESRNIMREGLQTQIETLQRYLSEACVDIFQHQKKDVLIFVDTLDRLETTDAERIFYKDVRNLTLPEAKMLFTFPLDTYYNERFLTSQYQYDDIFIPPVSLYDLAGNRNETSYQHLQKLVSVLTGNASRPLHWIT